jgi:hypothetical protein
MKAFGATIALLIFASAVAQPNGANGSLRGIILCEDTGTPARQANVYLVSATRGPNAFSSPERPLATVTDLDGNFSISDIPPGNYYVVAVYAGYISARDYFFPGAMSSGVTGKPENPPDFVQRVSIAPGDTSNITIRLRRGASIKGSVLYSDGKPVPNAALTPKMKLSDGSFADVSGGGASHTDNAGHYSIDGLPDGSYVVLGAMKGPLVPVFGGDRLGASGWIAFAGDGMRPSNAHVISVKAPNEYTGVDLTLELNGVHEVSGTVVAPDGH